MSCLLALTTNGEAGWGQRWAAPGQPTASRLRAEREPVHIDEVLARTGDELQEDRVRAGRPVHVGRHGAPALPAAGVGDREAADGRVAQAVDVHLDQAADPRP